MECPVISIIVPVYNAEDYLHRCVDSILAQTYSDIEVLLIDDGSTDGSGVICDDYAKKDNRVRVFHKNNGGVSSSRNLGLKEASGTWITFVDSDDWLDVEAISVCKDYFANYDLIRFPFMLVYDCEGKKKVRKELGNFSSIYDYFTEVISRRTLIQVWGGFYRSDIIKCNELLFDVDLNNGEDWLFLMNYVLSAKTIKTLNLPLYYYNVYNDSSCTNTMNVQKIFDGISSFNKVSERIGENPKYSKPLFEGKIALMSFCILGLFLNNTPSRELLCCRERLLDNVRPCPTFGDVAFSKLHFTEKVLTLSFFNASVFMVMGYIVGVYKRVSRYIRIKV